MKVGDRIYTTRFCTVRIKEVFETEEEARENGYKEPTYYKGNFDVLGKSIGINRMVFAAVKKSGAISMSWNFLLRLNGLNYIGALGKKGNELETYLDEIVRLGF